MAIPKIGLRISGTKQRRGGFQPLVAIGVLAGGEAGNMDRVPLVKEKPAYVVKHAPDYALYMLIDRHVKSFDADAPGVLTIALTIASDTQLADKKSPYTLLQEIYDTFASFYMTRLTDGRDSFVEKDAETEFFRQIIDKYPLEERHQQLATMTPEGSTGVVKVPKDKMEEFFRDTNYDEFRNYCDIEVGTECNCSPGLENIEIPKVTAYEIWINEKNTGRFLRKKEGEDKFLFNKEGFPKIHFALDELLDAPNQRLEMENATIVLDTQKNRILCDIAKPKTQNVSNPTSQRARLSIIAPKDVAPLIHNGKIKVKLGAVDVSKYYASKDKYYVNLEEIDNLEPSIEHTTDYVFKVGKKIFEYYGEHILQIIIETNKGETGETKQPKPEQPKPPKPIPNTPANDKKTRQQQEQHSNLPVMQQENVSEENNGKKTPPPFKLPKKSIIAIACGLILMLGIGGMIWHISKKEQTIAQNDKESPIIENPEGDEQDSTYVEPITEENPEDTETEPTTPDEENFDPDFLAGIMKEVAGEKPTGTTTSGKMTREKAINILLGVSTGNLNDAKKALGREANVIPSIKTTLSKIKDKTKTKQIIKNLMTGNYSASKALTELNKLVPPEPPKMNETTAIRILFGVRGLGTEADAKKVLTKTDLQDIQTIKELHTAIIGMSKPKKDRGNEVISKLKLGQITLAGAKTQLTKIKNGDM